MLNLHAYFLAINRLSIFTQKQDVVLTLNLSQVCVTHLISVRLGEDLECVGGVELIHFFSGHVLNLCG